MNDSLRSALSSRAHRLRQAWADLSLRTKLLLFALGLVTLPGVAFAFFAFSGARAALEREVGIQLHQTAERGADVIAAALELAHSDAQSWANQDIMRDLLIGDVDKRVSRFLQTVQRSKSTYLAVLCVDPAGAVVAASDGNWIGRSVSGWDGWDRVGNPQTLWGPFTANELVGPILRITVPLHNPDPPGDIIGHLLLIYRWSGIETLLDTIRVKLAELGKRIAAVIVDERGNVLGGVWFDGRPAQSATTTLRLGDGLSPGGYGRRKVALANATISVLVGAATTANPARQWAVVFLEPTDEALTPVHAVRQRWTLMLLGLLLLGLAAAVLLARQVMRPLDQVTRATSTIAARPDLDLPLLPVQSRNEIGQLTESFNKMTTALQRSQEEALSAAKFAFAGELAAMIAHEVRTPLSVLRSSAQMLAPSPPRAAPTVGCNDAERRHETETAELVETIVAEVDRIERVVTGLIELARPLQQHREATALGEILTRATAFVAAQARRQAVSIQCSTLAGPLAFCDPEQIYQVTLNLIVNALQALPTNGTIWVSTVPPANGWVGFEIRDDGPGLPHELREHIFEPFVTGRAGGTGLGLAFVERIIKAHQGTIAVRSQPGQGTTFAVRLPMAEDQ